MKKYAALGIGMLLLFSLVGCGQPKEARAQESSSLTMAEHNISAPAETSDAESSAEETLVSGTENHILIAYFSRVGNTEYPDGIDASTSASIVVDNDTFGTTEFVARMIQERVGGDLHLIQTQELYPSDFDVLRDQNHREMSEGYLPPLKESHLNMEQYDTVFIGYPVWATDTPQAVLSFLAEYNLSGKTVIPFCTHDGYGAGGSYTTVREASHAETVLEGLAIEAKDVPNSENTVAEWIEKLGVAGVNTEDESANTAIHITIGDRVLDGILYDTPLAQEIKEQFPLTISMSGFGGREYYGGVDFYPEHLEGGKKTFDNGDITYCEAHHNMAIFYAQTDDPILSVDVIPIGKVTSEMSEIGQLGGREDITFSLVE